MGTYVDQDSGSWHPYRAALQIAGSEAEMYWTWEDTGQTVTFYAKEGDALWITWQQMFTSRLVR